MLSSFISTRSMLLAIFILMAGNGVMSTLVSFRLESAGTLVGSASAADASNMKKLKFDGAAVSVNAGTTGGGGARARAPCTRNKFT